MAPLDGHAPLGCLLDLKCADLVATDGNPLGDITAVRRVVFFMKAGRLYRYQR